MSDILYILFLSWVVIYADFHLTRHNLGAAWNGVGMVPLVLRGVAKSPMQYRVLVPWLCGLLSRWFGVGDKKIAYLNIYLRIKWVAIVAALAGSFWYLGQVCLYPHVGVALMAAFFVWVALYDYADVYLEVAFLSVAFASMGTEYALLVASIVAFVAALNRETAVLIPMALLLSGAVSEAIIVGCFFAAGLYLPIQIYGKRERYCSWVMFRENWEGIKATFTCGNPFLLNEYGMFFAFLVGVAAIYTRAWLAWGLSPVELACGILFMGMLIPSMWREIRVFAPVTLALIPMALRGVTG